MTPDEVGPAIESLLMLTASAVTVHDAAHIEAALEAFDSPDAIRSLVHATVVRAADKLPNGARIVLLDPDDEVALRLLESDLAFGPDNLRDLIADMPDPLLAPVAVALLAIWHQACAQAAAITLRTTRIPEEV